MSTESLLAFLEDRHEAVPLEGDRPLLLTGDFAWFIVSGRIDLFGVSVDDGQPAGARRHVCRVTTGGLVLALPEDASADGSELLAVGAAGTRVLRLRGEEFRELWHDARWQGAVAERIDQWIDTLCKGITTAAMPKNVTELAPGERLRATEPIVVRPRERVGWITPSDGAAALLGRPQLAASGSVPLPISRSAWLATDTGVTFTAIDPRDIRDGPHLWSALAKLHRLVRCCVSLQRAESVAAEAERLERLDSANRGAVVSALVRLASAMDRRMASNAIGERRDGNDTSDYGELLAACRIVGDALGITFRAPPQNGDGRATDTPLDRIARASNVRVRRVVLKGEWWREDNGPLLGTRQDVDRPVALRRRGMEGFYEVVDPVDGSMERVTADVAAGLMPVAHTFYRSFKRSRISALDVLKFGVAGCGRDILTVLIVGALAGMLATAPAIATGILFNSVIPSAARSQVVQITAILLSIAVATAMLQLARSIAFLRIDGRMGAAVQAATWDRLLSLPMRFFRDYSAGELATRAMGVDGIRQILSGSVVTALLGGVFSIFSFLLMFHYSPALALRATGLLFIAFVVTVVVSYLQLETQRAATLLRAKTSGVVLQLLSAVSKIRVAAAESRVFGIWADLFGAQRSHQFDLRVIRNWFAVFAAVFPTTAALAIFASVGASASDLGPFGTGDFLAFFAAFSATLAATLSTGAGVVGALNVVPLYEQAKPILETPPEGHEGQVLPGPLKGHIEAQHLVFRYSAKGPLILHGVSFVAKPGEFIAFVGPSGSGKSTILRLILGFEQPESGAIYIDGQELSALDQREVRRQMGVVLQNGRVMSGDIFTNIVGSSLATREEAWDAARAAGLAQDIERMPMGMHTVITEGGGTLSGGQRQRLLIARAIVNRPRIVLFDEATSALDNRTQAIVSESLERLQATRIVVAHRLSTIINADTIYVVDGGRIVESGRHDELLARDGVFAELARRQVA